MNLNKKIIALSIFIIFISMCAVYSTYTHENADAVPVVSNETDAFGCCSIIWQQDGNNTIMSFRRDSNVTADVYIEKTNWNGIPCIKQYKTDAGYFNHVTITNDGWMIGLGGIDDGVDNQRCENITYKMISDNFTISQDSLKEIQDIKKEYGRGHVLIKAPNGNYGFATPTKLKTGTLKPGQYISMPNDYSLSRSGDVPLNTSDKIKAMVELSQSDLYGQDRREIITYDFKIGNGTNTTDIYVSNEDGSYLGIDYTDCIDNVIFNNNTIKGDDIPVAPDYEKIGNVTFDGSNSIFENPTSILIIAGVIVLIAVLFYAVLKLVRIIRFKIKR